MGKLFFEQSFSQVEYKAGERRSIEIPRANVLQSIDIRIKATLTAGATAATKLHDGGIDNFLKKITVKENGQLDVKSVSGRWLGALNYLWNRGRARVKTELPATLVDGTYETVYHIPFYFPPPALKPRDAALDARRRTSFLLSLDYANIGDIYASPGTSTIDSAEVTLSTSEILNVPLEGVTFAKDEHVEEIIDVKSTGRVQFDLPVGNVAYRTFSIFGTRQASSSEAEKLVSDLWTKVRLKSGSTVLKELEYKDLLARTARAHEVNPELELTGSPFTLGPFVNLNIPSFGQFSETIVPATNTQLVLEFDAVQTSGTERIYIVRENVPVQA